MATLFPLSPPWDRIFALLRHEPKRCISSNCLGFIRTHTHSHTHTHTHPTLQNSQPYNRAPALPEKRKKNPPHSSFQGIVLHYKHNTGVAGRTSHAYRLHFNKTALAYRWTTFHSIHTLYTIIISSEEGFDLVGFHRT